MVQSFQEDALELAMEKVKRGEISRRALFGAMAAMGMLPVAGRQASAQAAKEMVMVNWGGVANQGFGDFYAGPFMKANPEWKVAQDSTGPSAGRIRSMVESGKTTWDLCDSSAASSILLSKLGLLNKMDYSVINKADSIDPSFTLEYGAAPYSFTSVLVYDSAKYPTPPTSWADFWDLKKFPGTRLMRKDATVMLDIAQMALGKDPKNLYPLDLKACLNKIKEIRGSAVYWNNGAESEQFMRTGEASMGCIWHTRAKVLQDESKGRLKFIWNQGLLQAGIMVSPKGNPGGPMVQKLMASMMNNAEAQVSLLNLMGNGPTNPKAAAMVPDNLKPFNPTDPANVGLQVPLNGVYWGENYQNNNAEFMDVITG